MKFFRNKNLRKRISGFTPHLFSMFTWKKGVREVHLPPFLKAFKKGEGFTLVETLVAVAILLVTIVGPMTIAAQGLQASFFAREQTTAVFLAQEGIEAIEKLRDERAISEVYSRTPRIWQLCQNQVLPADPDEPAYEEYPDQDICENDSWGWVSQLNEDASCDTGCDYDGATDTFHQCVGGTSCTLQEDPDLSTGRYYQYVEGDHSQFTRTITVTDESTNSGNEVLVTVDVSWSAPLFGGDESNVTLQMRLFDQYE